jgi:NRAMP (natural resistance-associated macrophage protein)-like metal ion transporter
VALQLLFHVKLWVGVLMAAVITLVMLAVQRYGQRTMEAMVAGLILLVAMCFVAQLAMAQPRVGCRWAAWRRPPTWCAMRACCGWPPVSSGPR